MKRLARDCVSPAPRNTSVIFRCVSGVIAARTSVTDWQASSNSHGLWKRPLERVGLAQNQTNRIQALGISVLAKHFIHNCLFNRPFCHLPKSLSPSGSRWAFSLLLIVACLGYTYASSAQFSFKRTPRVLFEYRRTKSRLEYAQTAAANKILLVLFFRTS